MGWLGTLGKIASIAGAGVATGLTGGAAAPLLGTALGMGGAVASELGKQQEGKAQGKAAQAGLNQNQDRNAIGLYQAQQNAQNQAGQLDLQRKSFTTQDRGNTAKQALIGALLGGGITPTSISSNGASGGLLRSLNANPEALAALKTLGSQASTAQTTPMTFQGGQLLTPPKLTELPQVDEGGFLSTLAQIGELGGAASPYIAELLKKKPAAPAPYDFGGSE